MNSETRIILIDFGDAFLDQDREFNDTYIYKSLTKGKYNIRIGGRLTEVSFTTNSFRRVQNILSCFLMAEVLRSANLEYDFNEDLVTNITTHYDLTFRTDYKQYLSDMSSISDEGKFTDFINFLDKEFKILKTIHLGEDIKKKIKRKLMKFKLSENDLIPFKREALQRRLKFYTTETIPKEVLHFR